MNILMMTNTYTPIVGGLEKSVETFTEEYRKRGHRVIVVAPMFQGVPAGEKDVIRVPAVQNFNGTDFSVQLPVPGFLNEALKNFHPEIVHAHHPFLIGGTALRVAYQFNAPLVYTNHTQFEYNTHYVSDSQTLKRFAIQLSAGYADLADQVFVPSEGIRRMLLEQGVESPIAVVPSGIDIEQFTNADPKHIRKKMGISEGAFVAGFAGRLAPEKNLEFLSRAVCLFLQKKADACFLVVGKGPSEEAVRSIFRDHGLEKRLFFTGVLENKGLAEAYKAMDVFAFASKSETQGIAVIEAMAAGVPVAALDACGVQDVVEDGSNGILVSREDEKEFSRALTAIAGLASEKKKTMGRAALLTARRFSKGICAEKALSIYATLSTRKLERRQDVEAILGDSLWASALRQIRAEWKLVKNAAKAAAGAVIRKDNVQ